MLAVLNLPPGSRCFIARVCPPKGERKLKNMPDTPSPRQILKATPLFAALDDSEVNSLAARCGIRPFAPGEILFSEGEPCKGLYIVVTGRIRIFKISVSGREQVLSVEGAGASVAELPVFDGGDYPASGSAVEKTQALFVSRADLRAICLEKPEVALKMLQVVGARLRRLVGIIEELSFTTVRHRLISWLLRQASSEGHPGERGTVFTLNTSHQELAAQIGTVRELISRNLARLQAQSFIEMNGREITIIDRPGLEADLASI
jgi:CRP/FNR family cyclic AMP-dependent transcriptional regulator